MNILLISVNTEEAPYPVYPLGMSTVASALEKGGHSVSQADMLYAKQNKSEYLDKKIKECSPDVIGISLRNIDNVDYFTSEQHWQLDSLRLLIEKIRLQTTAAIILGGGGFSIMPEKILEYCNADYGIVGEGELSFCILLEQLEKNEKISKIFKSDMRCKGVEMNSPLYDDLLLDFYAQESGVLNIQTKRGCPNNCLYCTYPMLEGRVVRPREIEAVIEDIKYIIHRHKGCEIFFTDAVFNDHNGHWLTLVEAMAKAGLVIPWTAFFEPTGLSKSELSLCMRTGLKAVEFGTDATSDATLKGMKKRFNFESVLSSTNLCNSLDLPSAHFVIFGGPKETEATLKEGLNNLDLLTNSLVFAFLGIRIYEESPLMRYAVNEGTIEPQTNCLQPRYYFSPHINEADATIIIKNHFRRNKLRIFPPEKGQEKIHALRNLGYRGVLWDQLVMRKK
ncbi:lipid biosynthesis B12-binding/radical SAM protein [Desulfovibrio litoralis]|uniref:Lipid biosynthesis B12-binding/radical SAM protein n=1 Tax=Desulfovibrio litoralis DSM 11393 TaxID=1121455 RepID=A0A1M7STN6_9BACT|nr:lipid biosynthesis B12-binding/radical SAM protein [Desulfovibrio litoralis]SHN61875.1 lipid biosynthesis B12-binding/radical SAM protein [Desulfovibrio litoralis DSM 11393]